MCCMAMKLISLIAPAPTLQATNFISFFNRDFRARRTGTADDDGEDTLAMHCLLHMVALALLDAADELPPWFVKFAQKTTSCFKTSCKKRANFKALLQTAFEECLVQHPHPEKDEKLRHVSGVAHGYARVVTCLVAERVKGIRRERTLHCAPRHVTLLHVAHAPRRYALHHDFKLKTCTNRGSPFPHFLGCSWCAQVQDVALHALLPYKMAGHP